MKPLILLSFFLLGPIAWGNSLPREAILTATPESELASLQRRFQKEYGIKSISDAQSALVLKNFLFLLHHTLPDGFVRQLKTFRYLDTNADNNPSGETSSFHLENHSIAVPGKGYYPKGKLTQKERIQLLAALAHEIGHAFLFDKVSAAELQEISTRFGSWQSVFAKAPSHDLFSPAFFMHHPLFHHPNQFAKAAELKENSIPTGYALENIHEWFADSFAAYLLNRLGQGGYLGKGWHEALVTVPTKKREYWENYNNISNEFADWFQSKIAKR